MGNTEPIKVLFVDDEKKIRDLMQREFSRMGYVINCAATGEEALRRLQEQEHDVVLLDLKLPDIDGIQVLKEIKETNLLVEVIVLTGYGTINTAVEAMKLGAYDYLTKPCKLAEMEAILQKAYEKRSLSQQNPAFERSVSATDAFPQLAGRSPAMQEVLSLAEKVAPTDSTVLVQGESGTGKELIVQALHQRSRRSHLPLVTVNCATLQESLLESELFGHERGAFTGAFQQKPGLFELAHKGTLFLDEIGEMSSSLQAKLLRALQSGEIRRVGGSRIFKVDVRTIAATNKDLKKETLEGRFREDLYFRLNIITVQVPPLRERKEDIPPLVSHLLQKIQGKTNGRKWTSAELLEIFQRYDWPGNVRELENILERLVILTEGESITTKYLPAYMLDPKGSPTPGGEGPGPLLSLSELEHQHILLALEKNCGNKTKTAECLGITVRTLYNKLKAYQLPL